ncbi:MAG: beta-L-arabinofuranosidase domain-containing protein [Limisphaerales bacterium]
MKTPHLLCRFGCLLVGLFYLLDGPRSAAAQVDGGDQFLDGIGETALVARYLLDGNTSDRSRNGHHATLHGTGGSYVEDRQFGTVLSLPGTGGAFVQIPGESLEGADAMTVTGWVFLRSAEPWQRFFAFGPNTTTNFFCTPIGEGDAEGYRARLTRSGWTGEEGPTAPRVPTNQWVHLAVVLDAARPALSLYLDGARVGQSTNLTLNLEPLLDRDDARSNRLYLGKSHYDTDPYLDAKLHDVRLYSIALTDQQIATICKNALSAGDLAAPAKPIASQNAPGATGGTAWSASELLRVPDISVETVVGTLPRLPRLVAGEYRDGARGPGVRILWPSPTNNQSVLQPGTFTVTGRIAGTALEPKAVVTVKAAPAESPAPERGVETFPLDRVTLNLDEQERRTPFIQHRDKFIQGLVRADPDRFLYMFRDAFGQPQPEGTQPLGGWDSQTTRLRGHATGHYLSAIAQAYASTGYDPALRSDFLRKMNHLIDTLHDLSRKSGHPAQAGGPHHADPTTVPPGPGRTNYDSDLSREGIRTDYWNWGKGFISAYPPDQFIMLEQGATYGGGNHQIWAPYYTLHKILAGLLDCYEVGGNRKALEIAEGMGFWVRQRLEVVPGATRISMWNRYIAGEYGGMNEVMARLARLTGDPRFLECARLFDNIHFFFGDADHSHGLARNVDTLRGKHANQHIPQVTGALEIHRNTRERPYYQLADNFWHLCTESYLYSIGGVAGARNPNNAECFTAEPDSLFANGFARGGQNETCATYNLLKLSRQLFLYNPDARYMDYFEQALYNDILASVAPNNSGNTYHIPLNPGSRKQFGNANLDGFTCCNGTALESGTKLQDTLYLHSADHEALYVNLFVPSTLAWTERKVVLTQRTSFPYEDTTRLTIAGGGRFDLKIRVPQWATRGFHVHLNGQPQTVTAVPGSYLTLRNEWKDKDTIEVRMPFPFHLNRVMDQPNIASLFYGPVLLAAEESAPRSDWRPVTLDAEDLGKTITGDPTTLRFTIGDVAFRPFYETYDRYSVYLDVRLQPAIPPSGRSD